MLALIYTPSFLNDRKKNNESRKERGLRSISDMTADQPLIQRRRWKISKAKCKQRKNCENESNDTLSVDSSNLSPNSSRTKAGAKKARKNRKIMKNKIASLEKENQKLMKEKSDLRRRSDKYRKRSQRL